MTGTKEPEIETASNSTIEAQDQDVSKNDSGRTDAQTVPARQERDPSHNSPTLDQVRAVIHADFKTADDFRKQTAP